MDYEEKLLAFRDIVVKTDGWIGVDMDKPPDSESCWENNFDSALAMERAEHLYALAKRYHVTLILALGPLRCNPSNLTLSIQKLFADFHARHPDVIYPLPLYNQIPAHYLGDDVHVTSKEGMQYYSNMWGAALKKALAAN